MKIVFIVNEFPSLSETFILNQITGLIERGHEVDIYAGKPGNSVKIHPDVERYSLTNKTTYFPQIPKNKFLRVIRGIRLFFTHFHKHPLILLRSLNVFRYGKKAITLELFYPVTHLVSKKYTTYDIIHSHFGPNGLKACLLKQIGVLNGKKVVTTFYGYDVLKYIRKYGNDAYKPLFSTGDYFCCLSNFMKHQLIELGCVPEKILIHPLGIDCSKFSFTPRQKSSDSAVKLLTIARLVDKKGVEYAIRAAANLIHRKINIKYDIVGDGYLREELQHLIQQLDVSNNVTLLGWKKQQEVVEILNNSHALVLPSVTDKQGDQEGTPTVLMEGMAMGLPVVSTYHSGIPEVVENGVTGFLVPERDVDALAQKLNYLVEHPEIWSDMGAAGRAFVEENYNMDKVNDRLVEIYQSLIYSEIQSKSALTALVKN